MKLCVLGELPQEPCWDAAVSSLVRKSHSELVGVGNLWKMSQGKMEAWIYSTA